MIQLSETTSGNVRIAPFTEFGELSNYLGRYVKLEGIPFNSEGERGHTGFSRAGKLIAVFDFYYPKDKAHESERPGNSACGLIIEGFSKINLNFDSTTLVVSVLQSDTGTWKVIHEPKQKK